METECHIIINLAYHITLTQHVEVHGMRARGNSLPLFVLEGS